MTCRTIAEVEAAADAEHDGPLTQAQADLVAVILAPHITQATRAA
jgi:hypothetical protein